MSKALPNHKVFRLGLEEAKRTLEQIQIKVVVNGKPRLLTKEELFYGKIWVDRKHINITDLEFTNPSIKTLEQLGTTWEERATIKLPLLEHYESNPHASGYVPFVHYSKEFVYTEYLFPTLYPTIAFPECNSINGEAVIPIGTRTYQVIYHSPVYNEDKGYIEFIESTKAPNKFIVASMTPINSLLPIPTCQPRTAVLWFGQPCFVQSPIYPEFKGRAAFLLFRYESGWGDAGNEHVFIQFDESNRPCIAWSESSCS